MFIKANAIGIMFIFDIGGIQNQFPLLENSMRHGLFYFDFLLVPEEENVRLEEHVFVAINDKVMRVAISEIRKLRHYLVEKILFFYIGISL